MSQCAEPGCGGTVDGGYCVQCGVAASTSPPPAPPPASAPAVPAPRPPAAVPDDGCRQPGCTGSIMDGYCDVCGSPPAQDRKSVV